MIINQTIAPDIVSIKGHLHHITRRWGEIGQECLLEMVVLSASDKAEVKQVNHYTRDQIDLAAEDAKTWSELKCNVYVTVNPVDANNRPPAHKRAKKENILGTFFNWADADDETGASNIKSFVGPKTTFYVITGTLPTIRPHVYWELETFNRDLAAWEMTQRKIAATLQTDPAVVDAPRIMRLAGTINWPKPAKAEKGYTAEVVALHIKDDARAIPFEQMQKAFNSAPPVSIDTGTFDGRTADHYEDILTRAKTDGEKHTGVRDLAASLAGQGVNKELATAIIKQSTPVWDDNVEDLINSAYSKFYQPNPEPEPIEATPQTIADFPIVPLGTFIDRRKPTEYLIDGIMPRGMVYSLTGFPGHGKTTLSIQFAISVGSGTEFAGVETSKGGVVFLAGENPENLRQQVDAAISAYDGETPNIHFVEGRFSLAEMTEVFKAKIAKIPDVKLIIIDSLQAFFEGDNDNDNAQMVQMAHKLRALNDYEGAPAILVIAHPAGKKPEKDGLVPRGGGAFLAEIDGNLTCWAHDGQQTLHHTEKFRGAPFEPIEFIMEMKEFDHMVDHKGRLLRTPVSRPELTLERLNRENAYDNNLKTFLDLVAQERAPGQRELARLLGVSRHKAKAIIDDARSHKLVKPHGKTFKITKAGEEHAGL